MDKNDNEQKNGKWWIGITQNEEALQDNIRIVNKITKLKVKLQDIAKLKVRQYNHIECSTSRMKKYQESVQNAIECLQEWNSNPWDADSIKLRSLESGLLASKKLTEHFLIAFYLKHPPL